jgi:hypothetical protein
MSGTGTAISYCKRCGIILPQNDQMYRHDGYCVTCRIQIFDSTQQQFAKQPAKD